MGGRRKVSDGVTKRNAQDRLLQLPSLWVRRLDLPSAAVVDRAATPQFIPIGRANFAWHALCVMKCGHDLELHMKLRTSLITTLLIAASCGPTDEPIDETPITGPDSVTCEGPKCDGLSDRFRDAYDDMRSVDLDDLKLLSAGLATDQLNDALGDVPYSNLQLTPTALYGTQTEVLGQTTVHDINALRTGLTDRFGEDAFATRVVEMRRQHAAVSGDIWAESHFGIGPDLGHAWSFDAGDSAVGSVGFIANSTLETVVIAPYADKSETIVDAPLAAIKASRGWVVPRELHDVQAMEPGESLAMRGQGALGLNLGVGVPFLVGTIGSTIALHARLSFGARVAVSGQLDVQLIRGEGDLAWVDVGMEQQSVRDFSVALTSGFGLSGLPEVQVDLGVTDLSVTNLAEKALRKQLDKYLAPSLSATSSTATSRLTVARFRFDLAQVSEDGFDQALKQAMRGDIRLAQALANRDDSGVAQELDLTKDTRSESNYVGFRFLGMEFYRANSFDTGTISIEANGENQTLLFSEIERRSGLFFTDRQYEWRKLVSIKSVDGRLISADNNARMTIRESDSYLGRDQMLDHVDPFIGYFIGFDPMWNNVNSLADALAETIDDACDGPTAGSSVQERQEYDACLEALPTRPDVVAQRSELQQAVDLALAAGVNTGFDPAFATAPEVARQLLEFKIELTERVDRHDVALYGPKGKFLTQIRFSDAALDAMMVPGRHEDFRLAVEQVLRLMAARRVSDVGEKQEHIDRYIDRRQSRIDEIADMYAIGTVEWADLEDLSQVVLQGEKVGDYGHMVLIPERRPDDLDLASIAEHKGRIIEKLIPELIDLAEAGVFRDLDEPTEFVIAYALLWMADPAGVELLANYGFDEDDDLAFDDVDIYARGTSDLIEAGQFDLDELLGSNN